MFFLIQISEIIKLKKNFLHLQSLFSHYLQDFNFREKTKEPSVDGSF